MRRQYSAGRGVPAFKSRDTVLHRPDGDPASFLTVCPGEHRIAAADASSNEAVSVVWWAPDALALGVQASLGLRRDDLIVKDVPADVLRGQLDRYEAWKAGRRAAIEAGVQVSLSVVTATEWARRETGQAQEGSDIEVIVETSGAEERLPGGARFGTLVHALLANVPLTGTGADASLERLADAQGRLLGATPDEVAAARQAVRRVLAHQALRDAASAQQKGLCFREVPVTWRSADRSIVEGNVDLAYVDGDDVVVVDFKTDRELDGALDVYRRQMQIYAAAAGAALGKRPRAVLMRV
jgi:hypothetical protein